MLKKAQVVNHNDTQFHINVRAIAAEIVTKVVSGQSLTTLLQVKSALIPSELDQSLLAQLCYGTIRHYYYLESCLEQLIDKPIKSKQQIIRHLLFVGLYQVLYLELPNYAAVSETVNACKPLKRVWAKQLVNAVLRLALRKIKTQSVIDHFIHNSITAKWNHPLWMINAIKTAWPDYWQAILQANNQPPPMILRINAKQYNILTFKQQLTACEIAFESFEAITPNAIRLQTPTKIEKIPYFLDGACSVQDVSAQLIADIIQPSSGKKILDMCSAPGGKACALLERYPDIDMTCIDIDEHRLQKVKDNLKRLQLKAEVIQADARFWSDNLYDYIILDAPCSGTGVIRRHPDIKLLRQPRDIDMLVQIQADLLKTAIGLLKQNGQLIYCTCSILPNENENQIAQLIAENNSLKIESLHFPIGFATAHGWQILPDRGDGFFYALITKVG